MTPAERNRRYKLRHPDRVRAQRAAYKKRKWANGKLAREARRVARRATLAARRRVAKIKWKLRNKGCVNASTAHRFAAKMRATPAWADRKKIRRFYVLAALLDCHVDHIVPLRSPVVCGLHVEHNLQILPPKENMKKGNRLTTAFSGVGLVS